MPNQKIELIDAIAIARGTEEPTNRDVFWLDKSSEGGFYDRLKSYNYDTEKWELVSRSSNELLTDLKTVDGTGSGLDSDTLRGYTPEQLISQGASGLPAMSTGKIIVGQGDTIGQAKTLGGIATIDANGSMAYVTNSISHTGLTDVGTNTHVQIDSHIADSAIHLSAAQATKLSHISVTQAVDLDQMETDVTANNAKVTNATHTGDVTGATALTIADDAVTNAKSANVATQTIKGRNTAGTGDPEDLTSTQVRSIINVEDGATADQTDAEIETAYNNQVSEVTQAEAEAGTVTTVKRWTPERVKQAIDALGGGGSSNTLYNANDTIGTGRIATITDTLDFNEGSYNLFGLEKAKKLVYIGGSGSFGGYKDGVLNFHFNSTSGQGRLWPVTSGGSNGSLLLNGSLVEIENIRTKKPVIFGDAGTSSGDVNNLQFTFDGYAWKGINFLITQKGGGGADFELQTSPGGLAGTYLTAFKVNKNKTVDILGADTLSTSSAFKIYDGDTIPNTLWDFRNNGDLYVGGVLGFSGTGSYTNFTISNGVITSAS
tara:strand:+ start:535 stop:2169 length:1635 start_codon:yes stop_codon:yes gene_type:complete